MKMHTIRFSHDYEKLPIVWKETQAILWAVVYVPDMDKLKNRLPQFMNEDTKIRGKDEHFPIDFKEGLVLFLTHINTGRTFTTIRRSTPDKRAYYEKEAGNTFILQEVSQ